MIPRDRHPISRDDISEHALKVLYRLHKSGYDAYLVGGCVRDLLLGVTPKDFDVVTNATPEQIKGLFRNCRLIGKRFRLAHIVFGRDIIEVATFRGHHEADEDNENKSRLSKTGLVLRDNVFGSIEEDAARRDFTVNALYYNIADFSIYDFVGGMNDLESGVLKLIGDPEQRYREDPVRMLRAARFSTKLGLKIDDSCRLPIPQLSYLLDDIPAARLFEESLKLFLSQKAVANFEVLNELGLLAHLFPILKAPLKDSNSTEYRMIHQVMKDTDQRLNADKSVNPAYLFAAILWYPMVARAQEIIQESTLAEYDAFQIAAAEVTALQAKSISLPKRFSLPMRDIWLLQIRLRQQAPAKAKRLLSHPKFRAGYDFLLLRGHVENDNELAKLSVFWNDMQQEFSEHVQSKPTTKGPKRRTSRNRRRKPRNKKPDS